MHFKLSPLCHQPSGVLGDAGGRAQWRVVEAAGLGGGPVWGRRPWLSVMDGLWRFRSAARLHAHVCDITQLFVLVSLWRLTFWHRCLHSQMSAGMPWGTPEWGLQPVPVRRSHFIRRSPQCDGRARDGSPGGAGQPAEGGPRPYRRQRSVQAHWCLLLQFHVDLHQQGEVCSGYSRQCQQHHWVFLGAGFSQISWWVFKKTKKTSSWGLRTQWPNLFQKGLEFVPVGFNRKAIHD